MAGLFPNLWTTGKATERWLAKNPPEAYRDTIRVWGLLTIAVQRSWSRALVRVGADPRARLSPPCWGERGGHSGEGLSRVGETLGRLALKLPFQAAGQMSQKGGKRTFTPNYRWLFD